MIFWNVFLRFYLQSYLKLQMSTFGTLSIMVWATSDDKISSAITITVEVVLLALQVAFFFILKKKRKDLKKPSVKSKIGSLYLGIRDKKMSTLIYSTVFLARRLLFVILTFTLM